MLPKFDKPAKRHTNVTTHSYDPNTQNLTVHFHSGRSYRYSGVHPDLAHRLAKAPSQGSFLHTHIIDKHDATEITGK